MRLWINERKIPMIVIVLALIVVIVLGVLQYRWSEQVSEATSIRLADSLEMSMVNWHLDLFRALSDVCGAMQLDPDSAPLNDDQYVRRYREWKRSATDPDLVSGIYLIRLRPGKERELIYLSPNNEHFHESNWPSSLDVLDGELVQTTDSQVSNLTLDAAPHPSSQAGGWRFAGPPEKSGPLAGWQFEPRIPALVRSATLDSSRSRNRQFAPGEIEWMVIVLDWNELRNNVFPALAQRYFPGTDGLDYQVAVRTNRNEEPPLYSSDLGFTSAEITDADGVMDIFGRMRVAGRASPIHIFHAPLPQSDATASASVVWFPLVKDTGPDGDWRLIVRHRRGGALGTFVRDSRRRDLIISLGVLLLLVISMAILIVTSTRAQRLANLQMDFVASVSHELRAPLTVIISAAENLAHGVVGSKLQLAQYGTAIGTQANVLLDMVEQILLFASIRQGHQQYSRRPLNVADVLDAALTASDSLIFAEGFEVVQTIRPNLPQILGDLSALSQCLRNLIANALKYGGEDKWIGIDARLCDDGGSSAEIQISIADRGRGIDLAELPQIFEPFYRSPKVVEAQIHGSGLGLPLAKSIAEAMNGRITVSSKLGHGSVFTVHLPTIRDPALGSELGPTMSDVP
jgi:two-component system sensor histidine kinase SenX3